MLTSDAPTTRWLAHLFKYWTIFAFVTFCVMLFHQSDRPVVLGRYSTLVMAQLITLFIVTCGTGILAVYLATKPVLLDNINRQLESWRKQVIYTPLVLLIACGLLTVVWLFFLGDHVPTYSFLRLFIGASISVAALALLYGGAATQPIRWQVFPVGVVVVFSLLAIFVLPYFPTLAKTDEAFVFSMARNTLETGNFRPTIYRQIFPEHYYGGVWIWMMAGWLKVTGISLVAGRAYICFSVCFQSASFTSAPKNYMTGLQLGMLY